ncbi:hypothetical protein SAMN05216332_11339 [Nitrosospira briensis]|nr:hypothetical protein SAMN05216332_11339 [Nitrosospira briensis]
MTYYSGRMLKNPYRFASSEQMLHVMRTNKSAAARDQVHFKAPCGREAAR